MAKLLKERLVMPKKPPYELAEDYLVSKLLTRELYKPYTCGDKVSENTVSASNFMAKIELRRNEKLLKSKRAFALRKRKDLDEQWVDLQKREDNLRDMFTNFNEFVIDTNDKRTRASERISELKVVHKKRDQQITDLTDRCFELQEVKTQMTKKISEYKMFEEYLVSMAQAYPEDFENVLDVINRYDLIRHTSQQLLEQHEVELDCIERTKREFALMVDRRVVTLAGLHTRVARLRERHDAARRECRRWEELLGRVEAEAARRLADGVAVGDARRRIYREVCARRGRRPVLEGDSAGQLEAIKGALLDYRRLNEAARTAREEELLASERARPSKESV